MMHAVSNTDSATEPRHPSLRLYNAITGRTYPPALGVQSAGVPISRTG